MRLLHTLLLSLALPATFSSSVAWPEVTHVHCSQPTVAVSSHHAQIGTVSAYILAILDSVTLQKLLLRHALGSLLLPNKMYKQTFVS